MNNRIILAIVSLLTLVTQVSAKDNVTIKDFSISAGESKTLSIELANDIAYAAFQFDLYLPNGITVTAYSADKGRIPESTTLTMAEQTDGSYRFSAVAMELEKIKGKSGSIITIEVTAAKSLNSGSKTGYFRNVKLSKEDGTGNTYSEMSFPITVSEPIATYTLSIKATGNGTATYDGTTVREKTSKFTVEEGTNAKITFSPDEGCQVKSLKVNGTDVTSKIKSGSYTVSSISRNTSVEVEFEAIPPTTYTLSIKATGNGTATYDGTTVREKTSKFTVEEGTNAKITFSPDEGCQVKSLKVNGTDVTSKIKSGSYTVSSISKDTSVEVEFEAIPQERMIGDVNHDGKVNGTDIQAVINVIIDEEYDEDADVNQDNKVNGTDIQEIINIIVEE